MSTPVIYSSDYDDLINIKMMILMMMIMRNLRDGVVLLLSSGWFGDIAVWVSDLRRSIAPVPDL